MCVTSYPFWFCCARYKIQRRSRRAELPSSILRSDQTAIRYRPHPYGDPLLMEICGYPTRPMAGELFLDLHFSYQNRSGWWFFEEVFKWQWIEVKIRFRFWKKLWPCILFWTFKSLMFFGNMLGDGQQKTDFWNVNEFNNSSRSD